MEKIDLKVLKNYQQLPKVYIKPVKVMQDRIYFLKYVSDGKYRQYLEGIYCYYKTDEKIIRVDSGFHTKDPKSFYLFVPVSNEDLLSFSNMNYIVFSTIVQYLDEKDMAHIILYAIDIEKNRQLEVFSIKYNVNEFMYSGFRMLSDTYALIELGNKHSEEEKELDKLYLINIYDSQIDEVHDYYTKYTTGFMCMDKKSKNFYVEEVYMDEDHEYNVMNSDMYEINTQEIERSYVNPFKNNIKVYNLNDFLEKSRQKDKDIEPTRIIDSLGDKGIMRVIGSTGDYIYYKKALYDKYLKQSEYFDDRLLIGKQEIFVIDKNTAEMAKIERLDLEDFFCIGQDEPVKISQDSSNIKIYDLHDKKQIYDYKKASINEKYFDFILNQYLITNIENKNRSFFRIIDIKTGKLELECREVQYLENVVFYDDIILS
ncbi:hypothetical protein HMPREF1142_1579 [Peptostreptococcaceae bacterium AS15]|nr:hypothetical protein HMPREF1142_1579 [Peptostreptococcaceae bacterium AS15]